MSHTTTVICHLKMDVPARQPWGDNCELGQLKMQAERDGEAAVKALQALAWEHLKIRLVMTEIDVPGVLFHG